MNNYELAMVGVKIASKILHIDAPEVRFFIDEQARWKKHKYSLQS